MEERRRIATSKHFIEVDPALEAESGVTVRFEQFKNAYLYMTKRKYVFTQNDIVSVQSSFDSKLAITVLQATERLYYIRMYSLEDEDF